MNTEQLDIQTLEEPKYEERKAARSNQWLRHFDQLAGSYRKYRNRFSYYWKDSLKYFNYFIQPDQKVLQVGCGAGDTLAGIEADDKTGIDFSPNMIQEAKASYPEIKFLQQDAHDLDLKEKYDVILLSNVVGFFEDVETVFKNLRAVSHDETKIMISYYSRLWEPILKFGEMIGIKKKTPQQNWLAQQDIVNLLYLAGWETFRTQQRILLPINIPLISWFFNQFLARLPLFNQLCLNQFITARPMPSNEDFSKKYSVSVVVPARNESGNIEDAILRTPEMGKWTELIFIEGNSTDDTWETVQKMYDEYKGTRRMKIGQQTGKGKGDAVRLGYDMAEGDVLMILDADLTVPPEDLPKFYDAIASGKGEFINGCRLIYPMEAKAMRFLNTLGNKFFSYAFTWLLEQPIKDSLCGTKVLTREQYLKLAANRKFFGEFDPFGDFDLLFGAYKLNMKIIDLPIRYHERLYGDTNISRFRHGMILLRMCWFAARRIKFW